MHLRGDASRQRRRLDVIKRTVTSGSGTHALAARRQDHVIGIIIYSARPSFSRYRHSRDKDSVGVSGEAGRQASTQPDRRIGAGSGRWAGGWQGVGRGLAGVGYAYSTPQVSRSRQASTGYMLVGKREPRRVGASGRETASAGACVLILESELSSEIQDPSRERAAGTGHSQDAEERVRSPTRRGAHSTLSLASGTFRSQSSQQVQYPRGPTDRPVTWCTCDLAVAVRDICVQCSIVKRVDRRCARIRRVVNHRVRSDHAGSVVRRGDPRAATIGHRSIGDFLTAPRKKRVHRRVHLLLEVTRFGESWPRVGDCGRARSGFQDRPREDRHSAAMSVPPQLTSGRDRDLEGFR